MDTGWLPWWEKYIQLDERQAAMFSALILLLLSFFFLLVSETEAERLAPPWRLHPGPVDPDSAGILQDVRHEAPQTHLLRLPAVTGHMEAWSCGLRPAAQRDLGGTACDGLVAPTRQNPVEQRHNDQIVSFFTFDCWSFGIECLCYISAGWWERDQTRQIKILTTYSFFSFSSLFWHCPSTGKVKVKKMERLLFGNLFSLLFF